MSFVSIREDIDYCIMKYGNEPSKVRINTRLVERMLQENPVVGQDAEGVKTIFGIPTEVTDDVESWVIEV